MTVRIKLLIFLVTVTVIIITTSFLVIKTPATTPPPLHTNSDKRYILKDYNGMLAIYESNNNTPIEILDVNISSLPERDVKKIQNGIFADSLNEIISLAEDYE